MEWIFTFSQSRELPEYVLETILIKVISRGNPKKKASVSFNKLCFDTEYRVLEIFQILINEEYTVRDKMHRVFLGNMLKLIFFSRIEYFISIFY